ncbi:MAG: prolyl oligopeptidase family serine peptidase [Pseudomonadota bacterium]
MKVVAAIRSFLKYGILTVVLVSTLSLAWLRWDAGRSRDAWFGERQGQIADVDTELSVTPFDQLSQSVRLTSSSGLEVSMRVVRNADTNEPRPVIVVLGGHRTGRDAVDLFGDVGDRAVVGVDYPYNGPEKVKGFLQTVTTIPAARQAFLDTVPAIQLTLDWLVEQTWVDTENIILIGASLGAPFASAVAHRDTRISSLILVHAAADNRLWAEVQVARRVDTEALHYPVGTIVYWLAYGPIFDTSEHIAKVAPRPVLIIAARDDERTPADQAQLLFDAAGEPRRLRYTDGKHVQPNRPGVVAELLQIANEEMDFLMQQP